MDRLDDSSVLLLAGLTTAGFGAPMLLAPRHAYAYFYGSDRASAPPLDEPTMRWCGFANAVAAAYAITAAVGPGTTPASKRTALKVASVQWLASAALNLFYAKEGSERDKAGWINVGINLAVGGLCVWRVMARNRGRRPKASGP